MESVWDYMRADCLVWQLPMYSGTVVSQNNPGFDPPAAWNTCARRRGARPGVPAGRPPSEHARPRVGIRDRPELLRHHRMERRRWHFTASGEATACRWTRTIPTLSNGWRRPCKPSWRDTNSFSGRAAASTYCIRTVHNGSIRTTTPSSPISGPSAALDFTVRFPPGETRFTARRRPPAPLEPSLATHALAMP